MRILSALSISTALALLTACGTCPHDTHHANPEVLSEMHFKKVENQNRLLEIKAKLADAQARFVAGAIENYLKEISEPPAPGLSGTTKVTWPPDVQGGILRAQRTLHLKMKNHVQNLANGNTVAYKRTRVNFADLPYEKAERAGSGVAGQNEKPTGLSIGTGVRLVSTEKLFDQGALEKTGRDLDFALEGEGFFRVILSDGATTVYTRAGNFNLDENGNIVTSEGLLLDPPIAIPQNVTRIFVDQTGLVQGFDPDNPGDLQQIGQIELARFINPSGLEAMGGNLYRETAAAGDRIDGQAGLGQGFGLLRQGFLEGSNVDVFMEASELAQTLSLYRTLRNLQK